MNEQIEITTFNRAMESEKDESPLFEALFRLTEVQDPQIFLTAKGGQPTPLGSWSGWHW